MECRKLKNSLDLLKRLLKILHVKKFIGVYKKLLIDGRNEI